MNMPKVFFPIWMAVLLTLAASTAHAGLLGWFTSSAVSWEQVQRTGGIQIGSPVRKNGETILPLKQNVCRFDSAMVVRAVEARRRGANIALRIYTQLAEKNSPTTGAGDIVGLSHIPPGRYEVFYGTIGDPAKLLGTIEIP